MQFLRFIQIRNVKIIEGNSGDHSTVSDDSLTVSGHRYDYQRRHVVALETASLLSSVLLIPLLRRHQGEPRSESRGTERER